MVTALCFGGEWLDTDEGTRITLEKTNNIIEQGAPKMVYTLDLSVPATPKNCDVMAYGENPHGTGFRNKTGGIISMDGVLIKGTIGLVDFSGGRFNLLFTFGAMNNEGFTNTISSLMWVNHSGDTISFDGKDDSIPNTTLTWGFINYGNGSHPSGTMGTSNTPLLMPSANLGYIMHECAAALGYTIEVDGVEISLMSVTSAYSPYFYLFTLPSMKESPAEYNVAVSNYTPRRHNSNPPTITVTGDGNSLTDAGLQFSYSPNDTPNFYHSIWNIAEPCWSWRPTRDVTLAFPDRQNSTAGYTAVAFWSGTDFRGCTDENGRPTSAAFSVDLEGERPWFIFVPKIYWGTFPIVRPKWQYGAFRHEVFNTGTPYTFKVYHDNDMVVQGGDISLWDNLPDMTFTEIMDVYCKLVVAGYEVDEAAGVIRVTTFDGMVAAASSNGALLTEANTNVAGVGGIARCIEGWARHNNVHSDDSKDSWSVWRRDYEVINDMLEEKRDFGAIPFFSGWCQDYGDYEFHCDDISTDDNGDLQYEGNTYMMCADPNGGMPLHLNYINRELDMGGNFGKFTKWADQLSVNVLMPLTDFVALNMGSTAALFGRSWLIRSATWSDGVAELKLLSINFADMQ